MSQQDAIVDAIEQLAHRIRRSVAVDDADLVHIGHSSHQFGDDDPLRHQTLIERQTPAEIRDHVIAHGLYTARSRFRVPATGRAGFVNDRLGFPLRSSTELVGLMWIILDDHFTDEDLRECDATAAIVEGLLLDRSEEREGAEAHLNRVVALAVSGDADERARGIDALRDFGELPSATIAVLSMSFAHDADTPASVDHMRLLRRVWGQTTATFDTSAFAENTHTQGFGIVWMSGPPRQTDLISLADRVHDRVRSLDSTGGAKLHIGVGDVVEMDRAHVSFAHAEHALLIAIDEDSPRVAWEERPFEAFVTAVIRPHIDEQDLPPRLIDALGRQSDEVLTTLRTYLDTSANAAMTAERLYIHRATVYYRLKQFEDSTGISLADGRNRLIVHLWLLVANRIR
ncbi:PucR family transcriptional regulator [Brevibacterium jeotgali]|uniref:PucR C-terminal helix-turn-helix domain-containing protein n=1 Tax=Brevibacterium jeotgali TaxID=1262550 RepID=A0A2H1L6Y1_9MICO|nr:helix-turn-helix domain-containing protein [Brevibacterium jeotgali]TWC02297.1 PucR-like helix-turn-helix protein [Brevibacterium jeotgali]SMY12651.1 PucR C-terminal helix-turn-helix domain-containing protein [Brevibacterium jeotgali]